MDIKINYYCKVGSLSEYKIIMKNHYISPKGSIIKEQVLSADYHKKISSGLTPKSAKIIYTWDKVKYTSNNWHNEQVDTEWIFAKKRNFSNIKIYPEAVVTDMEQNEPDEGNLGIDYSDLISTPSVNLLYMLSWDVIGLEEIASFLVKDMNRYEETGSFISIDTISGTNAHMGFHGCEEKSFFKNRNFEAAYVGTGNWKECIGIWIEYRCIGRLESFNSNHKGNAKVQMASSCYFGKVLIDVENGNLLKGDMIELISGVIKTKNDKLVPQQKRRFVYMEMM